MASYTRELKQILREAGCDFEREGKGDHEIWYSPITGIRFVVDQKIGLGSNFAHDLLRNSIDTFLIQP